MRTDSSLNPAFLKAFSEVARLGSFSGAAARLGMTQSAVSQAVARLERQVGTALFVRGTRPLRLTPSGERFLAAAAGLLEEQRRFGEALEALRNQTVTRLAIGISEIADMVFGARLEEFLIGRLEALRVRTGFIPGMIEGYSRGDFDIVIVPELPAQPGGYARRLASEEYVAVTPRGPAVPGDGEEPKSLGRLLSGAGRSLPFISYPPDSLDRRQSQAILRTLHWNAAVAFELESSRAVASAVARGLGWSILSPLSLLGAADRLDAIAVHPLGRASRTKDLWIASRQRCFDAMADEIANLFFEMASQGGNAALAALMARSAVASHLHFGGGN